MSIPWCQQSLQVKTFQVLKEYWALHTAPKIKGQPSRSVSFSAVADRAKVDTDSDQDLKIRIFMCDWERRERMKGTGQTYSAIAASAALLL
jgi:hypothetical protein